MDNYDIKRIQGEMLEIAKEIKRICEKHNIAYFLVGGTLIGAARHKGFIPWDDDMDIGMLRSEYNRFIAVAPLELDQRFFLQTYDTDDEYGKAFAKIRKEGTLFKEEVDPKLKKHQGFWVDIFPYDNLPNERDKWKKFSKKIMFYRKCMYLKDGLKIWNTEKNRLKRFKIFVYYSFYIFIRSAFISRKKLIAKYSAEMNRYNDRETEYVCQESGGAKFGKYPIKRSYLTEFVSLPFEDTEFSCPKEYDSFLRGIYGDYMQLPPEEKRQNFHKITEVRYSN